MSRVEQARTEIARRRALAAGALTIAEQRGIIDPDEFRWLLAVLAAADGVLDRHQRRALRSAPDEPYCSNCCQLTHDNDLVYAAWPCPDAAAVLDLYAHAGRSGNGPEWASWTTALDLALADTRRYKLAGGSTWLARFCLVGLMRDEPVVHAPLALQERKSPPDYNRTRCGLNGTGLSWAMRRNLSAHARPCRRCWPQVPPPTLAPWAGWLT